MEVADERIPNDVYAVCTARLPEACVELVVRHAGGVLVVKRSNEPAKGRWFWPGARLYKGETTREGARRVADEELGIDVDLEGLLGVYDHFWETSPLPGRPSRHTVNAVYLAVPTEEDPRIGLDDQHSAVRVLTGVERDLHAYVRRSLEDHDLLG